MLLLLTALSGACGEAPSPLEEPDDSPVDIGVYAVWLEGSADEDRLRLDDFFECLIHGSTFASFWSGRVNMRYRGSLSIPAPSTQLVYPDTDALLHAPWASGALHLDGAGDERKLFVVFASGVDISLQANACGRTAVQPLGDEEVGVAFVRNNPLCWPTGERLRTETQIAMHELAEGIDRLLGDAPCVGDGACEGRAECAEDYCDNFVGLACDGAPVATWAGCEGRAIDGWVVQTLTSAGRSWETCETCLPCDFTPVVCGTSEGDCRDVETR